MTKPILIKPHGSDQLNPLLVDDAQRQALLQEAESLPSLLLNSAAAANAVMLGAGYFNPLSGYMNLADALSVSASLHTNEGLFWPVPVINLTKDCPIRHTTLLSPGIPAGWLLFYPALKALLQPAAFHGHEQHQADDYTHGGQNE